MNEIRYELIFGMLEALLVIMTMGFVAACMVYVGKILFAIGIIILMAFLVWTIIGNTEYNIRMSIRIEEELEALK